LLKKKQPLFFNNFTEDDMRALLTGAGFVDLQVTEVLAWEDIDTWIDTWETPALERAEIRALYTRATAEVRRAHPFEVDANGRILDKWRWLIFSCRKPA
jgi:DNA gyrase subunit B